MVQRTVSVGLVANVSNYVANMRRAEEATRKTAAAAVGSEKQLRSMGEVQTSVGRGMLAAGAVGAAGLAIVIKKTADFGAKMAQLQTVLGASQADMKQLSAAAMEQGKAYGYSATQVADAQIELAKAGVTVKQQLGGALKGALALAASGQIDVADATSISVQAMSQFKLAAKDLPHVADLLAAGAANTTASVDSLGQALSQSGGVAHQFGISLDDTVGVLSAFDQNALKGSDGGTAFKSMLLALASPSTVAKKKIDELGISAYDSQGNFVGVAKYAQILQDRLKSLTPEARNAALGIVFGSDAARAAGVFYDQGAKGIGRFIKQNQQAGYASAQAAGKLDSLSGDVQKLSAAFDTNLIKAGTGANDALRGIVQTGANLLDVVGDIPAPVASAGVALTAAATGVSLLGGAALIAVPKIMAFRRTMAEAGVSGKRLAGTFGKGGALLVGITAATAGIASLGSSTHGVANVQQLALGADQLAHSFRSVDDVFTDAGPGLSSWITGTKGAKSALDQLTGGPLQTFTRGLTESFDGITGMTGLGTHLSDVFKSNSQTFDAFGQQLAGLAQQDLSSAQQGFVQLNQQLGGTQDSARRALSQMSPYRDALAEIAQKAGVTASTTNLVAIAQGRGAASAKVAAYQEREAGAAAKEHANALAVLAGSADDGTSSVKALSDAIANLDGGQLSAREAARGFEQAIDDAAAAAKKNGRSLDISTQAGRDNQAALDGVARAAQQSADAYLKAGGSAAGASKIVRAGRKAYIDAAVSMGMSRSAARKLADALFQIPKVTKPKVVLTGDAAAKANIAALKRALQDINGFRATVEVAARVANAPNAAQVAKNAVGNLRRAGGGPIWGAGAKGVDSVPMVGAPGEHMVTASEVDAVGGQSSMYAIRAAMRAGTLTGYAGGGAIGDAKKDAKKFDRQNRYYRKQLAAAKKAEAAAEKAYDGISGKEKDRAAKKAAKARLEKAQKRVSNLEKWISEGEAAKEKADSASKQLREDREDFVSRERRGDVDPLSYVDQLRSMSRDENFSAKKRAKFADRANEYEKALVDLTKRTGEAAEKLSDLKQSSEQMASSITGSIAGRYQASSADSVQTTSGWQMQDGIRFETTSSALSAASIESYYGKGAGDTETFAGQLDQLRARGVDGRLLAEIAADPNGPALAAAMLSGSDSQIASINRDYGRIQTAAGAAGQTVADSNFKALIDSAQVNSDRLSKQLADDSAKLRKLIADAFGLPGYASGTPSAATGLRRVAENGAEIVTRPGYRIFGGGEQVLPAARTSALIRGGGWAAAVGRGSGMGQQMSVSGPESVTIVDADGTLIGSFRTAARSVARQEIHSNAAQAAVAWTGGAA